MIRHMKISSAIIKNPIGAGGKIMEGIGKAGEKIWEGIKGIGKKVVEKLSKNLFGERDKQDRESYPTQQEAVMPTPIKIGKKEEEEKGKRKRKTEIREKGEGKEIGKD